MILNIFYLTESFKGRVVDDFKKLIVFPLNIPLIILINLNYSPANIFSIKATFPINFSDNFKDVTS